VWRRNYFKYQSFDTFNFKFCEVGWNGPIWPNKVLPPISTCSKLQHNKIPFLVSVVRVTTTRKLLSAIWANRLRSHRNRQIESLGLLVLSALPILVNWALIIDQSIWFFAISLCIEGENWIAALIDTCCLGRGGLVPTATRAAGL
jgi:hypothetical protein